MKAAEARAELEKLGREIVEELKEVADLVDRALARIESDREWATLMLSNAADIEYETLGSCEVTDAVMKAHGIEEPVTPSEPSGSA